MGKFVIIILLADPLAGHSLIKHVCLMFSFCIKSYAFFMYVTWTHAWDTFSSPWGENLKKKKKEAESIYCDVEAFIEM